eukprot:3255998-Prymnesium_polylepis.1
MWGCGSGPRPPVGVAAVAACPIPPGEHVPSTTHSTEHAHARTSAAPIAFGAMSCRVCVRYHDIQCAGALCGTLPTCWPEGCIYSVARVLSPLSHVPPVSRNVFTQCADTTSYG